MKVNTTYFDFVVCDLCGKDYTHKDDFGGFLFQSKAVCPSCAPTFRISVVNHNEERFIKAECPINMSFRHWVVEVLRGGKPGTISVISFDE